MTTAVDEPRSIEDREARIAEIDQRVAEIDEEHANALMPEDIRDEWNRLNAERDQHEATVAELRARRQRLQAIAGTAGSTERGVPQDVVPALHRKRGDEIFDVTRIRAESTSEEDYRSRLHDNAKRAIEKASFPAFAGGRAKVQEHIESLLERCDDQNGSLAKRILATGSPMYSRAFGKAVMIGTHAWTAEEQRAMSVYGGSPVGAEGGFAVPFDLDPTVILTNDGSISPLRQIARVETITSKTWQGVTSSGVNVTRSGEGDESGDNSFQIDQPEVSPTRVIATIEFSVEVDQDWSQLRNEISRLLMDAKDREEDSSFVVGDGSGNNPSGVVSTLDASSEVDVATASTLVFDDLLGLEAALPVRFRRNARFMANKSVYQDIRGLAEGSDGAELWVRLAEGQPAGLLGYPSHEASAMDSLGDVDGRFLIFGDFREFIIVDRLGMTVELQPHVLGATNRRWTGQRAVNAIWRNSSLVLVDNAFRVLHDTQT